MRMVDVEGMPGPKGGPLRIQKLGHREHIVRRLLSNLDRNVVTLPGSNLELGLIYAVPRAFPSVLQLDSHIIGHCDHGFEYRCPVPNQTMCLDTRPRVARRDVTIRPLVLPSSGMSVWRRPGLDELPIARSIITGSDKKGDPGRLL
jgi:hypothetical protein